MSPVIRINGIGVREDKNFSSSSGTHGAFSVGLGFVEVLAVENRDVAESLYFRVGKFETDQLSAGCVEFDGFLKNVCLAPFVPSKGNLEWTYHKGPFTIFWLYHFYGKAIVYFRADAAAARNRSACLPVALLTLSPVRRYLISLSEQALLT